MKSFNLTTALMLRLLALGFCRGTEGVETTDIGRILLTVERLEQQLQDINSKIERIEERCPLLGSFSTICSRDQVTNLQESFLATFGEITSSITKCSSSDQLTNLQEKLATDECTDGSHGCSPEATCEDTFVGYKCICQDGYQGDGFSCADVDECLTGVHMCHAHGQCFNTPGSFTCACLPGYFGDGFTCNDIDECRTEVNTCHSNASCINEEESFRCSCLSGYSGDGFTCEDIDECSADVLECDRHADCVNTAGSFTCSCLHGYSGDGLSCEDINECRTGVHTCHIGRSRCANEEGSYRCTCFPGYSGNGSTCEDIDECSTDLNRCDSHAECINNVGSFTCSCLEGYSGDGFSCEEVLPCDPPSLIIDGLGCVTVMNDKVRSWDQAHNLCKEKGLRLIEGINSQSQLNQLSDRLKNYFVGFAWVGIRKLRWSEGGDLLDPQSSLWLHEYQEPDRGDQECGFLCVGCSGRPALADYRCSSSRFCLCHRGQ